jgi:hypothetical protein
MNGMTDATCASTLDTSRVITLGWSAATSYYEIEVPEPLRDLTAFTWLSFRGCQQSRAPQIVSLAAPLDFSVALVDSAGVASVLPFGDLGQFPSPYARTGLGSGSGWANEWSTVRLRLSDFEGGAAGFDLSDVGAIRFLFGEPYGSAQGRIGLDDIEVIP